MSLFGRSGRRRKKKKSASAPRREPKLMSGGTGGGGTRSASAGAARPRRKKQPRRHIFRWLALKLAAPVALMLLGFAVYIGYDLPDVNMISAVKKAPSIVIKDEEGTTLGSYGDVYGDFVPYNQLPKHLVDAVVATEDRNFFHHFGIDPVGMLRATYVNLRARRLVQGGSTITQQLAKNAFLTPERTMKRKLQEMILAVRLERRFKKEDILAIYLNRVYMGAGQYGVDAAARRYFGHPVQQVTLSEAAMLVGLLKAPTRYAPSSNPERSEKRGTQVLLNMVDAELLTEAEAKTAMKQFNDDDAVYRDTSGFGAYYFTDYVTGLATDLLGEQQGDIVITTTLRPKWQQAAEQAVEGVLSKRGGPVHAGQAALLSMSPDGAIRAMVGGRDYRRSQFNRAVQGQRQPGSAFKLFVFLAGLEGGYTPLSEMEDKPIAIGKWKPRDYTGKYQGMMTLRNAFAESINTIAVQLSEAVGRWKVIEMAERLGVASPMDPNPSIALGTAEVNLHEMTRAYAHLASGGLYVEPYAITRIETAEGKLLFERKAAGRAQVLRSDIVGMMNSMLLAVTGYGTGSGVQIGRPVAGKTGTTSDYRDAWFMGFTPQIVTGVWVGNDDTSPMKKVTGGNLPAAIFKTYMTEASKGMEVATIPSQNGGDGGGILPWFGGSEGPAPPAPEEEPTPRYDAPPSFWERLTGSDDVEHDYPGRRD